MIAAFLPAAVCPNLARAAGDPHGWATRQRLPGTHDRAAPPALVADRNRTVHALFSQPLGDDVGEVGIFYARWTVAAGWTAAASIILPPFRRQAWAQDALLDEHGFLHLVFFGGDDSAAHIYHARVPLVSADRAPAWSRPRIIGTPARTPRVAALRAFDDGKLLVVFGGDVVGKGLYSAESADGGETWSAAAPIFLTGGADLSPSALSVTIDAAGGVHAAWTVVGGHGNGEAIYYTHLHAGSWSEPVMLAAAKAAQYEVDWPSLIAHEGELLLIYDDFHPPRRQQLRSSDAGLIWREAEEPFAPTRGEYGPAQFAVDGGGRLHAVFGDRGRGLNLWHAVWDDGEWTTPEAIAPASEAERFRDGADTFHPNEPRALVSQGNVLLVVWRSDPGVVRNGLWSAHREIDAPALAVQRPPVPVVVPPSATPSPAEAPTPAVVRTSRQAAAPTSSSPLVHPIAPLLVAILAASLFLGAVLVTRAVRRRR